MLKIIHSILLLFICFNGLSQSKNNIELEKIYDEDQMLSNERGLQNYWFLEDSIREVRVYEMLKEDKIKTGKDFYHSAMIFYHSNDTLASSLAVAHIKKALELDSTIVNKWLLPATIDKYLVLRKKPQIYGTQYKKRTNGLKYERYEIDKSQITDKERKYYGIETIAEQEYGDHNMNLISISTYCSKSKSIETILNFLKIEIQNGYNSKYNINETILNDYGYELMSANRNEDALEIFKLNTEVYPNSYNAFDSYGECLLKLNKKKEGIKAYKKSLKLNPKNKNATEILNNNK
jgi:tetratricopeptide (TPR) repeat protein